MKPVIVYVYAASAGDKYLMYAMRFLESYHSNPPGLDHDTVIMINGQKANSELTCMFSSMPNCAFLEHDNSGYDIGAFQMAARTVPCEMMVFFGASTFFNRKGWLERMVWASNSYGNAQYGAMGNRGDLKVRVWPHIRTTAFWMRPELMNSYPARITSPNQRHPFEHGEQCFTSWLTRQGTKSLVVNWNNVLEWENWDDDENGFQRGDQSSLLAGDHICERPYYPNNICQRRGHPNYCEPWTTNNCHQCLMPSK